MSALSPEQVHQVFIKAFNAGDLDAIVALYEPGARIAPKSSKLADKLAEEKDAMREFLKGFLALKGTINLETKRVVQAGDLGLLHSRWSLKGTGPDGSPVSLIGTKTEVVRRQPGGTWLYVIDIPDSL